MNYTLYKKRENSLHETLLTTFDINEVIYAFLNEVILSFNYLKNFNVPTNTNTLHKICNYYLLTSFKKQMDSECKLKELLQETYLFTYNNDEITLTNLFISHDKIIFLKNYVSQECINKINFINNLITIKQPTATIINTHVRKNNKSTRHIKETTNTHVKKNILNEKSIKEIEDTNSDIGLLKQQLFIKMSRRHENLEKFKADKKTYEKIKEDVDKNVLESCPYIFKHKYDIFEKLKEHNIFNESYETYRIYYNLLVNVDENYNDENIEYETNDEDILLNNSNLLC